MTNIPQKVHDRLVAGIKKFQPVLVAAQQRDASESDTVIIITAIISEIFGYDPFKEITSEIAIRGTYCDLATKLDENIKSLIEAKAINQKLQESHVTQAVGYASTKGVDWVVLTNGLVWQVYKVTFSKPIDREKVVEIDFLKLDYHRAEDLESLFLLTKESWQKSALSDYYDKNQALSPFTIGQVLLTEPVLAIIRRELKRISPEVKIEIDKILEVLEQEVLKQNVVVGDKADEAHKRVARAANRAKRDKAGKDSEVADGATTAQNNTPEVSTSDTPPVPTKN